MDYSSQKASSPGLEALSSFPLFPKLPKKILKIVWRLSLWPHIVEIEFDKVPASIQQSTFQQPLRCAKTRDKLLSRRIVSALWYPAKILFSFSIDTVYLEKEFLEHVRLLFDILGAMKRCGIFNILQPII